MTVISIFISALALIVSSVTFWLTLLRRGEMKMTRPTIFGLLYDRSNDHAPRTKIYLRALLFSTAKRGQAIESMHATLRRNETQQTFGIWAFGEKALKVGGGMYVPEGGIVGNHHFVVSADDGNFTFRAGTYELKVFATVAGKDTVSLLFSQLFELNEQEAIALQDSKKGILFTWGPDSRRYHSSIDRLQENPARVEDLISSMSKIGSAHE